MQRNRMSSESEKTIELELRQIVAILGIVLTGVGAALTLPLGMAALCMLVALGALRAIARPEPVVESVIIRRDERR